MTRTRPTEPEVEQIQVLPLVALRDTVIFPEMIVPLQVGRDRSVKALDRAVRTSQPVALITQRSNETEEINSVDELYSIGTLAKIAQVIRLQDGTIRAIVQGQRRIRLLDLVQTEPHLEARIELIDESHEKTPEVEAPDGIGPGADRAVRRAPGHRCRRRSRSPRATSPTAGCWPTWSPTAPT